MKTQFIDLRGFEGLHEGSRAYYFTVFSLNTSNDSPCHEGSNNVKIFHVKNLEGQNHPGHAVAKADW